MNVVAFPEIVVDWLSLTPGETMLTATQFHRALGGNSTNVAIGLQRLGTAVQLVGKVGADFHGEFLKAALQAEGIALDHIITDPRYPTAQCYMTTGEHGEHYFRNWPNPHACDMWWPEDLPVELLRAADIAHTTGISLVAEPRRSTVIKAIEIASQAGAIISFDAGFPSTAQETARTAVEEVLSLAHLLKMNEFEVKFWSGEQEPLDLVATGRRMFDRYQPTALLLTLAGDGSYVLTANDTIKCQPLSVNAVSEVGAGDAYIAGVIHWLTGLLKNTSKPRSQALAALSSEQWRQAGWAGNIAGALTTLQHNAYSGMPSRQDLEDAMGLFTLQSEAQ